MVDDRTANMPKASKDVAQLAFAFYLSRVVETWFFSRVEITKLTRGSSSLHHGIDAL
jgi:hypothetical protein